MKTNTTILLEIAYQITNGNPKWGMLLANEYFDQAHPFRNALVAKFRNRIRATNQIDKELEQALIAGHKRAELSPRHVALVGARVVRKTRALCGPIKRDSSRLNVSARRSEGAKYTRLAARARDTRISRFAYAGS